MFNNLFSKSSIGLYIGDDSLRFIELKKSKSGLTVGRYGEIPIQATLVDKQSLKFLKNNFRSSSIHFSLANEYIQHAQDYLSLFKNSGIYITSFEPEIESLARSMVKKGDRGAYMIVNFGAREKSIFAVSNSAVKFISHSERTDDVIQNKNEIIKHFLEWHLDSEKNAGVPAQPIQKIIISGNGVKLAELAEYLSVGIRHNVEVANVWVNIFDPHKNIPEISFDESFNFAHALGLALKDL